MWMATVWEALHFTGTMALKQFSDGMSWWQFARSKQGFPNSISLDHQNFQCLSQYLFRAHRPAAPPENTPKIPSPPLVS